MNRKRSILTLLLAMLCGGMMAQTTITSSMHTLEASGSYILTEDVILENWEPVQGFTGTIDGRGYCINIKNLNYEGNYCGFIGSSNGATIKNLVVKGGVAAGNLALGGIVGHAKNTTFINCESAVDVSSTNAPMEAGGLVGIMDGGTMTNCISYGRVAGFKIGGLVGKTLNGAQVRNSYSLAEMCYFGSNEDDYIGGLVGKNAGNLENCYVRYEEQGWYIPSLAQMQMIIGEQGLIYEKCLDAGWENVVTHEENLRQMVSNQATQNNLTAKHFDYTGYGAINQCGFGEARRYQVRLITDFYGGGHNIGDLVYISGTPAAVFYVNEDDTGGWAVALQGTIGSANLFSFVSGSQESTGLWNALRDENLIIDRDNTTFTYTRGYSGSTVPNADYITCEYELAQNQEILPPQYNGNMGRRCTEFIRQWELEHGLNTTGATHNTVMGSIVLDQLAAENTGTVKKCYYPKKSAEMRVVGSGTAATDSKRFSETETPYMYGEYGSRIYDAADEQTRTETTLAEQLNTWVDANIGENPVLARWTNPTTTAINEDQPILEYNFTIDGGDADAKRVNTTVSGTDKFSSHLLRYCRIDDAYSRGFTTADNTLAYYGNYDGITANNVSSKTPWDADLYFTEDATIKFATGGSLQGFAGVTFDNSDASGFAGANYDWHMVSAPVTEAPMGLVYGSPQSSPSFNGPIDLTGFVAESADHKDGYFPFNTPITSMDFYSYMESTDHWINFKRLCNNHWHQGTQAHITYDGTDNANGAKMTVGKGYLMAIDQKTYMQVYGTLNKGDLSYATSHALQGDPTRIGTNLIGNPYQAYLDFDQFYTDNADYLLLGKTYSILDADKQGYIHYVPEGSENPIYADRYIHPQQGFLVRVNDQCDLTFKDTQAALTATSHFRDGETVNYPLVNLIAIDGNRKKEYATVELGRPEVGGAVKIQGIHSGNCEMSISYNNAQYSAAFTTGAIKEIPVRFTAGANGTFTMQWNTLHGEFDYLHLVDNLTGADVDCLTSSEYVFNATTDDYASRFKLVFEYTDVEEEVAEPEDFAFFMDGNIVVNGQGRLDLVDLNGRVLFTTDLYDAQNIIGMPNVAEGLYLLRLTNGKSTRVQKIVSKL